MDNRKFIPLLLLAVKGGEKIDGRTRLQKLVFLLDRKFGWDNFPDFDYMPYDYGPFSKKLAEDVTELTEKGLIEEKRIQKGDGIYKYVYALTDKGENVVSSFEVDNKQVMRDKARKVKEQYNHKALPKLLDLVYNEFPKFAEKSVL